MRNVYSDEMNNIHFLTSILSFKLDFYLSFVNNTNGQKQANVLQQNNQSYSLNSTQSMGPSVCKDLKNYYENIRNSITGFCDNANENFLSILLYLNSLEPKNLNRSKMENLIEFMKKYSEQLGKYNNMLQNFSHNIMSNIIPNSSVDFSSLVENLSQAQPIQQSLNNNNFNNNDQFGELNDRNGNKASQETRKDSNSSSKFFDIMKKEEKIFLKHKDTRGEKHYSLSFVKKQKKGSCKKITACPHTDKRHYAKNMCNNCYHIKGRKKKAWKCPHTDKFHYALGICQNCYQFLYIQKLKTK